VSVVTACGAAVFFGNTLLRREPPPQTLAAVVAPAVSPPAPVVRDTVPAALATAQTETIAVATAIAAPSHAPQPPRAPDPPRAAEPQIVPDTLRIDESGPSFDVARIERNGDAVIAGRAAPGATVELIRNGERLDRAVADQSGQFVMIPPRLPAGNYALTLRSKLPDGTLATSKEVAVALDAPEPSPAALQSRAELPFNVPQTKATGPLRQDAALASPQTVAATTPDATPAPAGPRIATATVSRGDSLWRISRLTYGVGTEYAVVYKANREHIRDPNRIYPGQVFILPSKAR
jgi:nucleoid-associated protein YgaU